MLIKNPSQCVLDYANFDWVLEGEKVPKKELVKFCRKLFAELTATVTIAEKEEERQQQAEEPEEEPEETEEEKDDYTEDLRKTLLENVYDSFSINENGDVLLSSSDDENEDLLFTDSHAAKLMPVLKASAKKRAEKLSQLFGNL